MNPAAQANVQLQEDRASNLHPPQIIEEPEVEEQESPPKSKEMKSESKVDKDRLQLFIANGKKIAEKNKESMEVKRKTNQEML